MSGAEALRPPPGSWPQAVAGAPGSCATDLALALLRAAARRTGAGVAGRTLGVVGFAAAGEALAGRARREFGMRVIAPDAGAAHLAGGEAARDLDGMLARADFVAVGGDGARRRLIDGRALDLMKPTAFLISACAGETVDARALVQSLWFGTIAGAALCAGDAETCRDLRECANAVVLPHPRAPARLRLVAEGGGLAARPRRAC